MTIKHPAVALQDALSDHTDATLTIILLILAVIVVLIALYGNRLLKLVAIPYIVLP